MRKIVVFIFFVLLSGCSNIVFLYDNETDQKDKRVFNYKIIGDNKEIAKSYLANTFNSNEDTSYLLSISISEKITAQKTELNSTVSKYQVKHTIKYILKNTEKNCLVSEQTKTTLDSYDSKSSGYSFGSDSAKEQVIKNNIINNIDSFINTLDKKNTNYKCNEG